MVLPSVWKERVGQVGQLGVAPSVEVGWLAFLALVAQVERVQRAQVSWPPLRVVSLALQQVSNLARRGAARRTFRVA